MTGEGDMDGLPPLLGPAPALACTRWLVDAPCGRDATWHVIWTPEIDNGLCCEEHMDEAKSQWGYYAAHRYDPVCSIAGAVFIHDENRCVVLDDGLELTVEPVVVRSGG